MIILIHRFLVMMYIEGSWILRTESCWLAVIALRLLEETKLLRLLDIPRRHEAKSNHADSCEMTYSQNLPHLAGVSLLVASQHEKHT